MLGTRQVEWGVVCVKELPIKIAESRYFSFTSYVKPIDLKEKRVVTTRYLIEELVEVWPHTFRTATDMRCVVSGCWHPALSV